MGNEEFYHEEHEGDYPVKKKKGILIMKTDERIGKLVEARDAVRFLDDLANLPPAVMAVRFDSAEKRKLAFSDAVDLLFGFVHDEIAAVNVEEIDLAGELAEAKAENARLTRAVADLGKLAGLAAEASARMEPNPSSPPPAATASGATPPSEGARSPLPKYVARKGKNFECNVQRKGVNFRKGGFDTAQEAHDYAVERIKEAGGDATDGRHTHKGGSTNKDLPRFVYARNGKFEALCNRKNMYFCKTGFATADKASKWAEAEFVRKSAGSKNPPPAAGPATVAETTPPAGPSPGNRGRPRTRADLKAAIAESQERTEKREWSECDDCGYMLGDADDTMPDSCPNCGSKEVVKMEGVPGGDAVEVKG